MVNFESLNDRFLKIKERIIYPHAMLYEISSNYRHLYKPIDTRFTDEEALRLIYFTPSPFLKDTISIFETYLYS